MAHSADESERVWQEAYRLLTRARDLLGQVERALQRIEPIPERTAALEARVALLERAVERLEITDRESAAEIGELAGRFSEVDVPTVPGVPHPNIPAPAAIPSRPSTSPLRAAAIPYAVTAVAVLAMTLAAVLARACGVEMPQVPR